MDINLKIQVTAAAERLKNLGAKEVYVFGSTASGQDRPESDVDLAVSGLPPGKYFSAIGIAEDQLGRSVDLIDLDEGSLFAGFLKTEGKLLRVA